MELSLREYVWIGDGKSGTNGKKTCHLLMKTLQTAPVFTRRQLRPGGYLLPGEGRGVDGAGYAQNGLNAIHNDIGCVLGAVEYFRKQPLCSFHGCVKIQSERYYRSVVQNSFYPALSISNRVCKCAFLRFFELYPIRSKLWFVSLLGN
jgi:hypothetical protein